MKTIFYQVRNLILTKFGVYKKSYLVQTNKSKRKLNKELKKVESEAYYAGTKKTGSVENLIKSFSAECDQQQRKVVSSLKTKLTDLKVKLSHVENALNIDDKKAFNLEIAKYQSTHNSQLANELATIKSLNREKKKTENRLNRVDSMIQSDAPTKRKGLDKEIVFIVFSILIVILEATVTVVIWEKLLDTIYILAIVASLVFSGLLIATAHMIGEAWRKEQQLIRPLILGACGLTFISIARIYAQSENWFVTLPAIWLLYFTSVVISIRKFENAKNFNFLDEQKNLLKKLETIDEKRMLSMAISCNLANNSHIHAHDNITAQKNNNIELKALLEGKIEDVEKEIEETTNNFEIYRTASISKIEEAYELGKIEAFDDKDDGTQNNNAFSWGNRAAMFSLALFLMFTTSACDNIKEPDSYAIYAGLDKSGSSIDSLLPPAEILHRKIKTIMDLYGTHNYGIKGEIKLFHIGSPILSKTSNFNIETGIELLQKRQTVKDSLIAFDQRLMTGIQSFLDTKLNDQSTNLYRNVGFRLNELSKTDATHKVMIIASDAVAQSNVLDYANYQKNPRILRDDFEKLASTLDDALQVNDLSGIEIILVYSDIDSSELSWYSREFFKRYYESKNATVTLISNF